MASSSPVLVFNATGMIGSALVQQLLSKGATVVAAVRDTSKPSAKLPSAVQQVQVDFADPQSLQQAVASTGAKRAFGLQFIVSDVLLKALQAGGLEHVALVTTSFIGLPTEPMALQQWQIANETTVKASGLAYTFLRAEAFMSNAFRWAPQLATGRVALSHPDAPSRYVAFDDIAAVAATALTTTQYDNKAVTVQGPAAITERQQLQHIAQLLGQPIEVVQVSEADFKAVATQFMPPPVVDSVHIVSRFREERGADFQAQTDALVTGSVGFEQFIAQNKHEFTGSK